MRVIASAIRPYNEITLIPTPYKYRNPIPTNAISVQLQMSVCPQSLNMLLTVPSIDVKVPFPFYLQVNTNDPRQGHRGRPKRLGIMNKLISGRPIPSSGIHQ
ncbi:hypothetical protein TNCV_4814781 [Trichonephila clavipes]|nr:hypothetical protein TNCV_4814781 [Trichonephila clavipes]